MSLISGITSNSAKHLQLDAGCFIKSYDLSKSWDAQTANIIGATAGGGSFSAVPTIRQIEVDGHKGAVKGWETIDEWVVNLTANVKEITADSLALALTSGTTESATSPSGYTKITAANDIADTNYLTNIAWVGRISGSSDPVIIIVKNAIATNGLSLTMADKAEGVIAMTITGHYSADDLDTPPFEIYYPTIS